MTKIIECYSNVTDSCPDYRHDGPALMNVEAFNAFIIGTCVNRNKLVEDDTSIWEVYPDSPRVPWQQFCRRMIIVIQCSVNKRQGFGCSDECYDFLLHSSYVGLPVECLETKSTEFKGIGIYKEIPTKLPENQNKTDTEEPNTTIDDTVSSATCNMFQ
ncbi:unnamed protein product [Mytilus coruscus]|uniref:Uncharacterized protein n=1 Tax=Mytilus coruscus TaxID=42192 RepID=A0A6J8A8W1_MYTCO|nr:unnamed protein product [Mytilus coruscus]